MERGKSMDNEMRYRGKPLSTYSKEELIEIIKLMHENHKVETAMLQAERDEAMICEARKRFFPFF